MTGGLPDSVAETEAVVGVGVKSTKRGWRASRGVGEWTAMICIALEERGGEG